MRPTEVMRTLHILCVELWPLLNYIWSWFGVIGTIHNCIACTKSNETYFTSARSYDDGSIRNVVDLVVFQQDPRKLTKKIFVSNRCVFCLFIRSSLDSHLYCVSCNHAFKAISKIVKNYAENAHKVCSGVLCVKLRHKNALRWSYHANLVIFLALANTRHYADDKIQNKNENIQKTFFFQLP